MMLLSTKSKAYNTHNTYYLLPIPIRILCALLVLVVTPVTLAQLPGVWQPCQFDTGFCIDTSVYDCSVPTVTGQCGGSNAFRCCPEPGGVIGGPSVDDECIVEGGGLCKLQSNCFTGETIQFLCPGPADVRCCIPPEPTCAGIDELHEKISNLTEALESCGKSSKSTSSSSKTSNKGTGTGDRKKRRG